MDPSPTRQSASDAIAELARNFPRPTNAQALAALDAPFEGRDAARGIAAGFRPEIAEAWFMELGILPRMRMVACGFERRGDALRRSDDTAWWAAPYKLPLWVPLATYAATAEAAGHTEWVFEPKLAQGDSALLSRALLAVTQEIQEVRRLVADGCLPYKVPTKPGQQPIAVPMCIAAIRAAQKVARDGIPGDPTKPPPGAKAASLVAMGILLYVAYRVARKHL